MSEVPTLAGASLSVAVGLLAWGWWRRALLIVAVGLVLLAALLLSSGRVLALRSGAVPELAEERAIVTITVRLGPGKQSMGRFGEYWWTHAELRSVEGRGAAWSSHQQIRVSASGELAASWREHLPGATVVAVVRLEPADPGEPVAAVARARASPIPVAPPDPVSGAVAEVRSGLQQAARVLPGEPAALLPALVVGDTSAMSRELTDRFARTGLIHLAAVSGANLTLLLASLLWLLRRLGVTGWWLRATAAVAVGGYVLVCHSEPSVLRAAAMGVVGMAGLGLGGRVQGLRYLAWAVVALVGIEPWLALSPGFVLSVLATGGIVVCARRWTTALGWLPSGLAEAIAVPLAAQLATQPVVTALSGEISVVGVVTNLVAGPLVGPATVLGFLCTAAGWWWPAGAAVLAHLAGWPVQAICWTAALGDSVTTAALAWPATPVGIAVVSAACAAVMVLGEAALGRRLVAVGAVLVLIGVALRPAAPPGWPPQGWQLVVCDVGQGSATLVNSGPGEAVVIDVGPEPRAIDRCLKEVGVERISALILTHNHADHVAGLAGLGARPVAAVITGATGPEWGPGLIRAGPGLVLSTGTARIEVIQAWEAGFAGEVESSVENDASVVTRIQTPSLTVLLPGDLEPDGQRRALASGASLRADVLVVPHHGSARQDRGFLAAVAAPIAVVGVGRDNDYGHPAPSALRLLSELGARTFRTDLHGSVAVRVVGQDRIVTTQREGG